MAPTLLLSAVLALSLAPGDATHLSPGPQPRDPVVGSRIESGSSGRVASSAAASGAAAALAASALLSVAGRRKDGDDIDDLDFSPAGALGLRPPRDVLVVFVPGHGSSSSSETFADLIDLMGLERDQARHFDYRWSADGPDHPDAASGATVDDTAGVLAAYLAGLSALGHPIHLVGHSKGGASIAELVEQWDRGFLPPVRGVVGATLLDPPMATGIHGTLQSVGRWFGLPHDGGYDPVECSFVVWNCTDFRDGLGASSGVDVAVIRSPDAAVTNFADHPEGLAVYEASDAGLSMWEAIRSGPFAAAAAAEHAHNAVLFDPGVAACIVGQMGSGPCPLSVAGAVPPSSAIAHGVGGSLAARTL